MRSLLARLGLLLATVALPLSWGANPPVIGSMDVSIINSSPSGIPVTGVTMGSNLPNGFVLYLYPPSTGPAFAPTGFVNITWTNTLTNVSTVFPFNSVAKDPSFYSVVIPPALFSTVVSGSVNVNITVTEVTGTSQPAIFTLNPPLTSLGPALAVLTHNVDYPQINFVAGGTPPYSISAVGGTVPPGMATYASGPGVAGNPTSTGVFTFLPAVSDFWGNTIQPSISVEVVDNATVTSVQPISASAGAAATTIALKGTNFVAPVTLTGGSFPGTIVQWTTPSSGTVSLTTTFTDASNITASIPASLLVKPVAAGISVVQPNDVSSGSLSFYVIGVSFIGAPLYLPQNVVQAGTSVTMSSNLDGSGTIDGTVTFSEGGNTIGTGAIVNNSASYTTSALTPGVHNILATYPGNSTHTGSSSATSQLIVVGAATVTSLSPNSTPVGSATLTLTVNGTNFVPPSIVSFNGTQLPTTYISPTRLTAVVSNVLLTTIATVPVLVVNPFFGSSNSLPFTLTPSLAISTNVLPGATAGQSYSTTLIGTGGVPPYNWTVSGLPAVLSVNPTTGQISGLAQVGGTYTVAVVLKDSTNVTVSRSLSFTVNPPPVQVNTTSPLPNGTVGVPYLATVSAQGGATPYTFGLQGGSFPPGLTLAPTGFISGTPKTPGPFTFGIQVTDFNGVTNSGTFGVIILPAPLSLIGGGSGTVGTPLSIVFSGAGGVPPYAFSITGTLPPGTSASGSTLSGTPTTAGNYSVRVVLSDSTNANVTQNVTIAIAPQPIPLTISGSLGNGQVNVAYTGQLSAAGGTPPYTFSGAGVPPGVSISATGAVTGTPTTPGDYIVVATVTDSAAAAAPNTASARFPVSITAAIPALTITTFALPNAVAGAAYSANLGASGGTPPYTWTVTGLPAGVTATAAGVLSGTPTATGSFKVSATVTDSSRLTATQSYTLAVAAPPLVITTASVPNGTVGAAYSATLAATGGATPYTWTAIGLPAGLTLSAAGAISGTPTAPAAATLAVTLKDASGATASKSYSLSIALPPAPPLNFSGISATSPPLQQPVVQLSLGNSFPLDVAVTLTLTFAPDNGGDDPTIQFATGGRVARITVPAGSTNGLTTVGVQTGSVAGLITITASMQAAGADVTPAPVPTRTIRIAALAPTATSVTATRTSTGFTVTVIGYVTDRELTQAIFAFTAATGSNLQTTTLTVPVGPTFASYFGGASAAPFGSQFSFTETFTVTGSTQAITAVTVTLVNNVGQSTPVTATLN